MHTTLLSTADLERLLHRRSLPEREGLFLCTVMEPLQIADTILKDRSCLNWSEFLSEYRSAEVSERLHIAPLDADCLHRALFEHSESYDVIGLWSAVCERGLPPDRTVRRLILRPSEETWWEDELYDAMEAWCGEPADG